MYYILGILAFPIGALLYYCLIGLLDFLFGEDTTGNILDF